MRLGIDVDPSCAYPFSANNGVDFLLADVRGFDPDAIRHHLADCDATVVAGCAPCQTFSTYTQGARGSDRDDRWSLLDDFGGAIASLRPDIVTMENVGFLERHAIFGEFTRRLRELGYRVAFALVDCRHYGMPQSRRRLVLLASLHGEIALPPVTTPDPDQWVTVRDAIGDLPSLQAGAADPNDPLHVASLLSDLNLRRIRASRPGGTWREWPQELIAPCHGRRSGRSYPSVYGRMEWNKPSPTITGQCYGFGNGRFGHPIQDRAISLREAALLQTFPTDYAFMPPGERIQFKRIGRMIGNAVPPQLGAVIGMAIMRHLG